MAFLNNSVYDAALTVLTTKGNRLDICSSEPTTYTAATTTNTLGNKTSIVIGSPADRTPSGRKITISAISGGSVTGTGTAAYWAISDVANTTLLATGSLTASQSVTSGNTFSLTAFDIGIPAAS